MAKIDSDLLARLPLADISRVTFYKRDEITSDLICCDIAVADRVWTFHEELVGWSLLIDHLQKLPNFLVEWFASVSQPPFTRSEVIAFVRE
jgi:hypothetical protein